MAKAVGIDLGTTNSVVSVLEGGDPVVIPNSEGARTTPSVVAFSKTGEVLVGEVAKRQAITNPDRTFRSVKRHIGEDWKTDDVDGKQYTPQEISARTLMKLKRDAESYLGDTRHPGRHHGPRVLRRRPAHRHEGSRHDRRPRSAAHHQRADRSCARLRPREGLRRRDHPRVRPRWRHVRRVGARDRRRRVRSQVHRTATPTSVATTGISASSTGSSTSSRQPTESTSAPTAWRLSVCRKQRRRPRSSSARPRARRSTCRSSPPRPTARSTSTSSSRRSKFQEMTADLIERCRRPVRAGTQGRRRERR